MVVQVLILSWVAWLPAFTASYQLSRVGGRFDPVDVLFWFCPLVWVQYILAWALTSDITSYINNIENRVTLGCRPDLCSERVAYSHV